MASVIVTPTAQRQLETLVRTHSLPESTAARFRRALDTLHAFPLAGAPLAGRWSGLRYVLGPWRWMIVIYRYYPDADQVRVVSVRDAREATSPTSSR